MDGLRPVLLGMTSKDLWPIVHGVALCGWALLCTVPYWKHTRTLTLVPALLNAIVYATILLPMILFPETGSPQLDLSTMDSVFRLFGNPDIFFVGWVHYLCFDLLVARGLATDAIDTCHASHLKFYGLVVPCLLMTLYVGPVGFLLYMILRNLGILKTDNPRDDPMAKP